MNTLFAASMVAGTVYDIGWASNIAWLYAWWTIFISIIVGGMIGFAKLIAHLVEEETTGFNETDDIKKKKEAILEVFRKMACARPVPRWVDITYDIGIVTLMAAAGWFVTGFFFIIQIYMGHIVYGTKDAK